MMADDDDGGGIDEGGGGEWQRLGEGEDRMLKKKISK
jgi:hypothetical protein